MKLHLPKSFLTAVLAAIATVPTYAATTGWGNTNGQPGAFYFIDNADTISILGTENDNARISIVADIADLEATASLTTKSGITLAVCQNPWDPYHVFKHLLLTQYDIQDSGSVDLEIKNGAKVTINRVNGSFSSVLNEGTLTIGTSAQGDTTASTTILSGTITNNGTLTILGNVAVQDWSGFSYTYFGGEDATTNGLYDAVKKYTILSGNALETGSTTTFTYDGNTYNIADGYTDSTMKVYAVVSETVTVGGENADTGTTDADAFLINGGTLKVAEGSLDNSMVNYSSGTIQLENGTRMTGLTAAANATVINAISGTGTIEVAAHATDWNQTINTRANTGDGAFTGTTYVTSGLFTYDPGKLGTVLRLGANTHMQVNGGGSLAHDMELDSGLHQVHINGNNTFTIENKTISGDGVFSKNGPNGTLLIIGTTTIANYQHSAGTTNMEGGSIASLKVTGDSMNVTGGNIGHLHTTGGTLNLSGTATLDGSGPANSYRVAGLYIDGGTVNVGNGSDTYALTTTRVEMGDNAEGTLNVKQNATLSITGADVVGVDGGENAYWKTGFLMGEYGSTGIVNVEGKLLVKNAHIAHGNNNGFLNIKDGAIVATKGLNGASNHGTPNASGRITLSLEDGGKLILGEGGIDVSNLTSNLAAGTISISADAEIKDGIVLSSATGTTFDTQKWNWNEGGTAIEQGTEGGTLTISGAIVDHVVSTTTGEGDDAVTSTNTYPGKLIKTGAGTLKLTGVNTHSGGTSIQGGTLEASNTTALGTGPVEVLEDATLAIDTTSDGTITGDVTLNEGSTMIVRPKSGNNTITANLKVAGNATLRSGWGGDSGVIAGSILGEGKLELAQPAWGEGFSENTWKITSEINDKSITEKLAIESNANVVIATKNSYSGGTIISGRTLTTANKDALGTGKVTMNAGTLTQSSELAVSAMDYNGGTVNNNGQKLTIEGTLKIADNTTMTIEGAGANDIGTLELGAGLNADTYALTSTGSLTLGSLSLNLTNYVAGEYKLVSATDLTWTTGSFTTTGLGDGLTAQVGYAEGSSTNLILTIGEATNPGSTDWSILGAEYSGGDNGTLTLTVGADLLDYDFTNDGAIIIPGISNAMMKDILGLTAADTDGFVGISLVGADGETVSANADQRIGFQGKAGIYYGENVDGNWQYYVQYIPEPTTATLSLLALAGLAARRRRR